MIVEPSDGYVKVLGFKLYYRSFGRPEKGTVLALAGGPLATHHYLQSMADLVPFGYRVVLYDQLGCGKSDRPEASLVNVHARAVDEAEGVRKALALGRVHLFGNSYGGALALDVALKYPKGLRSLVISSGLASYALWDSEWNRLLSRFPKQIRETIVTCEAKGDVKNPEYLAAIDTFYRRHFCRLRIWPYELWYTYSHLSDTDSSSSVRLQGWDVTDRLSEIEMPCLVTVGKYDLVTPKCARAIHRGIRGSKLVVFERGSHTPMWENRERFIEIVRDFLDGVPASPRKRP